MAILGIIISLSVPIIAAQLELRSEVVELSKPWISLGDILVCENDGCEEIQDILLANFEDREWMTVDQSQINALLDSENLSFSYRWSDESLPRCEIKALKSTVSKEEIEFVIQEQIRSLLPSSIQLEEWRITSKVGMAVWPQEYTVRVPDFDQQRFGDVFWIQERFLRQKNLAVEIVQNDRVLAREHLPFRARFLVQMPVARQHLSSKHIVQVEDSEYQWLNLASRSRLELFSKEDTLGLELKQDIPLGETFSKRHLKKPIAVKRGQDIEVFMNRHGVSVRLKARSLEHAGVGDRLKIYIPASKKTLNAIIHSSDRVEIVL